MKKIIYCSITLLAFTFTNACNTQNINHQTQNTEIKIDKNLKWSERMALSEIHRFPDPTLLDFKEKPVWSYTNGLVLQAVYDVYKQNGNKDLYNYVYDFANRMIDKDGNIDTYKFDSYNLDMIKSGDPILFLYEDTNENRFKLALDQLDLQLKYQPTTKEGGYWHKLIYPHQMWLDGVYMAEPFHARYATKFLSKKEQTEAFNKIVKQFEIIEKYNRDPKTGLYIHGWDESKTQKWANKETGLSPHVWSRAMGWYGMALVDVLDYLPANHPGREKLIKYLNQYAEAITKVQDKSGVWFQVLDEPNRNGNYLEASGSTMFVYTLAKAANKGYIDKKYMQNALKGYNGILKEFIKVDEKGIVSLEKCCSVGGLGGNPYRDGSFEYYMSEPIRANDPKGTGPFIMASIELNK